MDIADRISNKEYLVNLKKNLKHMLEENGLTDMAKETQEEIDDLKQSIDQDRDIQKIEAKTSGRKTWRDDAWKYALVFFGGMMMLRIVEFILSKI